MCFFGDEILWVIGGMEVFYISDWIFVIGSFGIKKIVNMEELRIVYVIEM